MPASEESNTMEIQVTPVANGSMGTIFIQIQDLMSNIMKDIEVQRCLKELNIILSACHQQQLAECVKGIDIPRIFDCINSSESEQIAAACDILNCCLPCLDSQLVCTNYRELLLRALKHPKHIVKEMVLKELIRATGHNQVFRVLNDDETTLSLVDCLCDEELSVGKMAGNLFIAIGCSGSGLSVLCRPKVVEKLSEKLDENEIFKVRFLEVLVNIAELSEDKLRQLETLGLLNGLLSTLKSDDNLAILATLEVITPLAATSHGWDFLAKHKILKLLSEQIVTINENPLGVIVYPGLAKFFGYIGQQCPQHFVNVCPDVLGAFFKGVESKDVNVMITSLEALGFFAFTAPGKIILKNEKGMKQVMRQCFDAILLCPTEWRVRALGSLANLMHFDRVEKARETLEIIDGAEELDMITSSLALEWFEHLTEAGKDNSLQTLFDLSKQPFPEIKIAALVVLREISAHEWGQRLLYQHPGMMVFLMNRKEDQTLEGKKLKYAIVRSIALSPKISSIVQDESEVERLNEFITQGVNHEDPIVQVATTGAE